MHSPFSQSVWLVLGCVTFFVVTNGLGCIFHLVDVMGRLWIALYVAFQAAIGAQLALHGIWCVLAPLSWANRLLVGAMSGLVLYGSVVAVWIVVPILRSDLYDGGSLTAALTGLLCLPLLAIGAQTPLWIMRTWLRWRIVHRDNGDPNQFEPLRIAHLLLAMAVVSGALAAADASQSRGPSRGDESTVELAIAALIITAISAATVLPAVLACLRARRLPLALGLAFALDAALVAGYVALGVFLGHGQFDRELLTVFSVLVGSYFVTLTAPLLIARRLGYRLLWGRG